MLSYTYYIRKEVYLCTEARRKASSKYLKDTVETIAFRVPKGEKEKLKDVAERVGLSLNAFISEAVKEKIEKEDIQKREEAGQ